MKLYWLTSNYGKFFLCCIFVCGFISCKNVHDATSSLCEAILLHQFYHSYLHLRILCNLARISLFLSLFFIFSSFSMFSFILLAHSLILSVSFNKKLSGTLFNFSTARSKRLTSFGKFKSVKVCRIFMTDIQYWNIQSSMFIMIFNRSFFSLFNRRDKFLLRFHFSFNYIYKNQKLNEHTQSARHFFNISTSVFFH